ncbi:ATP-binding protein [Rhodovastum atsumiense]|nr:ATP-binding protein [Rhodovastum atsumiense]
MDRPLVTLALAQEPDVVAVRQRVRHVAARLGMDPQDQTRLATAVSEIARNAIVHGGGGRAEILLLQDPQPMLAVRIADQGPGIADLDAALYGADRWRAGMGLLGARRLTDRFIIESRPGGTVVLLGKALPPGTALPSAGALAAPPASREDPALALREANGELLRTLSALQARQEDLDRLNRELEDTNRGVVALYAELDEKARELGEASELKSRFISNMSHEFRTPLNSILALSRLLLDRTDGELSAEQEKQVLFIRQSAGSLLDLVNDLLDLAKIEAGKVEIRPASLRVGDLFAGLRGMFKPLQANRSVELVFEPPADPPDLVTDETKLTQILRNLIGNALKFTETGEVRVSVAALEEDRVAFTVSDTGIGIAPVDQGRIFEPFEQVESSLQARNKGTGLGLPLSRRLAELLGGTLTVSSTPGAGASFRLVIPLRHAAALPAPGPRAGWRRVLVIDDEDAARYVLRRLIGAEPGWEAIEAADGLSGLQQARELQPDAILLDLNMPGLDGFSLLRALTADPATRAVPVVVCTSLPVDGALRARLPRGVPVLSKSVLDRASLCEALHLAAAMEAGACPTTD